MAAFTPARAPLPPPGAPCCWETRWWPRAGGRAPPPPPRPGPLGATWSRCLGSSVNSWYLWGREKRGESGDGVWDPMWKTCGWDGGPPVFSLTPKHQTAIALYLQPPPSFSSLLQGADLKLQRRPRQGGSSRTLPFQNQQIGFVQPQLPLSPQGLCPCPPPRDWPQSFLHSIPSPSRIFSCGFSSSEHFPFPGNFFS